MTRILVVGSADFNDPTFVHNTLCMVNRDYGPVTCLIHSNHAQALAWQQWAARSAIVKHLPVLEDWAHDGIEAPRRCRLRLFRANPDYVVVFRARDHKTVATISPRVESIIAHAEREGVPVLTFESLVMRQDVRTPAKRAARKAA